MRPSTRSHAGLSPQARGSRVGVYRPLIDYGSIPASAGEPFCGIRWDTSVGVYPRKRGGAKVIEDEPVVSQGLSPQARGSLSAFFLPLLRSGSIPASAGEPSAANSLIAIFQVYPRKRGGAIGSKTTTDRQNGLSPQARGSRTHR